MLRLELFYIMGAYDNASKMAEYAATLIRYHAGSIIVSEYWFYRSLTLFALYDQVPLQQRRRYRRKIRRFRKRFDVLAAENSHNFKHKQLILQGEKARLDGRLDKALGLFKDAVASAQEAGFTHMAALAYELAARVALRQGYQPLAESFVQEANTAYLKWGALAKSQMLMHKYPQYRSGPLRGAGLPASRQLDFATVVSALQTISTEIVLDRLLKKLMGIVVENAGAQRVLFILNQENGLVVKASSSVGGPIRITNQAMPIQNRADLLLSGIHFVQHTLESVVIDNAQTHNDYSTDPYVLRYRPKSIFCLPVVRHTQLVAMLYLENNIVTGAFTPDRIEILQLIASQAAISIENARLYKNVTQKERDLVDLSENLRSLSSELLLTEERERRRIAVELHDRIGHALANVKMELGALSEELDGGGSAERMDRIGQLVDQSIEDTQSLTFELSPPVLYDLGLEAAVEWLVDQMREQYRIAIDFDDDLNPKPLDETIRVLAFQASRELLFNIVKHAHAHHAWVALKRASGAVHIEICDDGIGMPTSVQGRTTMRKSGGFGIFSIQERLKHAGGRLEITSQPGEGTQMTLILPMQSEEKDEL
jgi:signal transduction histidine kinase